MLSDAARKLFGDIGAGPLPVKGNARAVRELEGAGLVIVTKRRDAFVLSMAGRYAKAQNPGGQAGASC